MKLYLLTLGTEHHELGCCLAAVVSALNEHHARFIMQGRTATGRSIPGSETAAAWRSPEMSSCLLIGGESYRDAGLVLADYGD